MSKVSNYYALIFWFLNRIQFPPQFLISSLNSMLLVSGRDLTFPPLTAVYKLIIELLLGPQLPSLLDMV